MRGRVNSYHDKNSMMGFKVVTKLVSNLMTDHHFLILHDAWTVIFIQPATKQQQLKLARENDPEG